MNLSLRLITEQTGKRFQKISKPNGKPKPTRQARGEGFKKNQPLYGLILAKIGVARTKVDTLSTNVGTQSISAGTRNINDEAQTINDGTLRINGEALSINDDSPHFTVDTPAIISASSFNSDSIRLCARLFRRSFQ